MNIVIASAAKPRLGRRTEMDADKCVHRAKDPPRRNGLSKFRGIWDGRDRVDACPLRDDKQLFNSDIFYDERSFPGSIL
jgi:hypothetical protein